MRFEVLGFFPPTSGVINGNSSLARFPGVPIVLLRGAPGGLRANVFLEGVPEWIVLFVLEFGVLANNVRGVLKEKGAGFARRWAATGRTLILLACSANLRVCNVSLMSCALGDTQKTIEIRQVSVRLSRSTQVRGVSL